MNTNQSELHVVFGTGPLGLAVMRELLRQGKKVRMVNRSGQAETPADVEVCPADVSQPEQARQASQGASVVYQCAQPPYYQWLEKFPTLQRNILEGAASTGAKLVVADNLYLYGQVQGPIREDSPVAPCSRKGRVRAEMAAEVLASHSSGKVRATIGRSSDFFGPFVDGSSAGDRMFGFAVNGKAAEGHGKLDLPHTYTFIDDFGKALVILGEREEALGQAWHVPSPRTVTTRQFIELIFKELGKPVKLTGMGHGMMWMAGLFVPEARETVEMMYEFEYPFVMDHSKFTQAFGDHATPLENAIGQTVNWYRQNYVAK